MEGAVLVSLGCIGVYILLVGAAAFLEQYVAKHLDALHLDALLRMGTFALAFSALLAQPLLPGVGPSGTQLLVPIKPVALAGIGIGLLAGLGSICYCFALDRLPGYVVASTGNVYIAVTVVLGLVLLREPLTLVTGGGLLLTGAGAVMLSYHHPHRSQRQDPSAGSTTSPIHRLLHGHNAGLRWVAAYILLVGVSAFLEKPTLAQLDPLQLNALVALGMLVVGMAGLPLSHPTKPERAETIRRSSWEAVGLGIIIGVGVIFYYLGLTHLPVSVAATLSNAYIVVPVALTALIGRARVTWPKVMGLLVILAGAALLALGTR